MKLYLMRHGQAAASPQNPEQVLTAAGRAAIERLAGQLAQQGCALRRIIHSDKIRARQTAEIMAARIAPDVIPETYPGLRPNDNPLILASDINAWQEDTLIVSHLPFIPGLLSLLSIAPRSGGDIDFEPGTIVCLTPAAEYWQIEWLSAP